MGKSVPAEQVFAELAKDPATRAEFERHAVADAVSVWLVGYRAAHGLSQRQLAARVGMKQSAVARLESGDIEPKMSTLLRLSRALGKPLELQVQHWDPPTVETVIIGVAQPLAA
jgi:ribosome-binding protein aMBF1 (putative translation factor)